MKIAVSYEDEKTIAPQFADTKQFKLYTVDGIDITESEIVDAPSFGQEALAYFLAGQGAKYVICHGLDPVGLNALTKLKIYVASGVHGIPDQAAQALIDGYLVVANEEALETRKAGCGDACDCDGDCGDDCDSCCH